jgi:hypothetical protein
MMAYRPDLEIGEIHVYAFSQHNHPLVYERNWIFWLFFYLKIIEKQVLTHWRSNNLMPHANPPKIFVTPDSIEWTFLQTIRDDTKMDKFRHKNNCKIIQQKDKKCLRKRFRYFCYRKFSKWKCQFMLLAMKNTNLGYHVYQYGEHNHPLQPKIKNKSKI